LILKFFEEKKIFKQFRILHLEDFLSEAAMSEFDRRIYKALYRP